MAVLAIYRKKHWADDDTFALFKMSIDSYNARYQPGDIVAVYDDSRWKDSIVIPPRPENAAVYIHITNNDYSVLPAAKLIALAKAYTDTDKVLRRSRYHINWQLLPSGVLNTLIQERYIRVTIQQVKNNLSLLDKIIDPQTQEETPVDIDVVISEA